MRENNQSSQSTYAQQLLAALLGVVLIGWGSLLSVPGREAVAASPAFASPITATASLGTVVTVPFTLTNATTQTVLAQIYEGWPTPSVAAPTAQAGWPTTPALPDRPGPLDPALEAELHATGRAEMLVFLHDQADLAKALTFTAWDARGQWVMETLQAHAARTQANLRQTLEKQGIPYQPWWVVNALSVTGDFALAEQLATRPEVALVTNNRQYTLDWTPPNTTPFSNTPLTDTLPWGVEKISAPAVWADWGVRGAGVVVANIDTGVAYSHPALLNNYRGWSPSGLDHNYNWYDAATAAAAPDDVVGHGTHTLGTIAGGGMSGWTALGVAPGAQWIAVRGCEGVVCTDESLIRAAQWVLAPTQLDGTAPRPDLRPHIVSNSWTKNSSDPWYAGYVNAWNAAGIFSVFAVGNAGSNGCGSAGAPANYATTLAVGATDDNDFITSFSSRGPTVDNRIKPDLTAPGLFIPSAWPDGSVQLSSGTSMATPHVAGVAALLWAANPSLIGNLAATWQVLTQTAVPLTSPVVECGPANTTPNNLYGWGRVDAWAAVQAARVDVPWLSAPTSLTLTAQSTQVITLTLDARQVAAPGDYAARLLVVYANTQESTPITFTVLPDPNAVQLTGQFFNQWTQAGVYGRLWANGSGPFATTANGAYTLTLLPDVYTLTASATGYVPQNLVLSLTLTHTQAFTLTPDLPHLQWAAEPLSATLNFGAKVTRALTVSNLGPQPLSVTLSVPHLEWRVAAFTPHGGLYDMSAFAALPLGDDLVYTHPFTLSFSVPIFGAPANQLFVSSNGWASASATRPLSPAPWAVCLPWGSLPSRTLAPFWADLDPSQGGAVKAGQVNSQTFVVSYEGLPLWEEAPPPNPPTYTFQIALHASGAVQYLYGDLGPMPPKWSVGFSDGEYRGQSLACASAPVALPGQQWTLHNQPASPLWVAFDPPTLTVPPQTSAPVTVTLQGFGSASWFTPPFHGQLQLTTNDPANRQVTLPATTTIAPPPFQWWLPVVAKR